MVLISMAYFFNKNHYLKSSLLKQFKQNISFKYILEPLTSFCNLKHTNKSSKLLLFAFVLSKPSNFNKRQLIRTSWYKNSNLKVIFLIGNANDAYTNQRIYFEHQAFKDILQANFTDNYRSLTLKSLLGIQWTAKYCSSHFVAKIDDDVLVNTNYLSVYLKELIKVKSNIKNTFICNVNWNAPVKRIRNHKFYVSNKEFWFDYYEKYCDGPAYIFTNDLSRNLVYAAVHTELFRFEDVYIGMLASKLKCKFMDAKAKYASENDIDYLLKIKEVNTKLFFYPINETNFRVLWLKVNQQKLK